MTIKRVRKAVFPGRGFGTRFLPATKAVPKECCRSSIGR
jgi:UTP-glucose-1-phosphate uridylyltransferase